MKKGFLFIAFFVLILSTAGCKKVKDSDTSSPDVKGRYVESSLSLPKEVSNNGYTYALTKKEGMPFLFALSRESSHISGYQMKPDGTWTENTPKWLKTLSLKADYINSLEIFEDTDGNQYLYYVEFKNSSESFLGHLLRSTDDSTHEILHPEGWDSAAKTKYYIPPKVAALENGDLVALYNTGKAEIYDRKKLTLKDSFSENSWDDTILCTIGQSVIMAQKNRAGKIQSIDMYDTSNKKSKTSYPFQSPLSGFAYLDINDAGDFILCTPDGIHLLEHGSSLWQTTVDGTATSLSMPTLNSDDFTSDSKGNYYILQHSNTSYSLIKYQYDSSIPSVPSKELTIYSLKDIPTLRQAAVTFQQKHPDVKISFTIIMSEEEYQEADPAIREDYIRTLNTELLAGKGSDILVLDGLPVGSYVEKSLLTDISDILQPMLDKGKLYPNIMNNYRKDNKFFYVPARFQLQLLCGRSSDVSKLTTIDSLSNYASEKKDTSLLGNMTLSDFITVFSPYLSTKIIDSKGQISKDNLVSLLQKLKTLGDNCGIKKDCNSRQRIMELAVTSPVPMVLTPCNGFIDAIVPIGMTSHIKGSYTLFEDSFTPICELGITTTSSQQKLGKEFIAYLLSEEIQTNDLSDGFSINPAALSKCSQADRRSYSAGFCSDDGSLDEITLTATTPKQTQDLVNYCSSVSSRAVCDEYLLDTLKTEIKEFFEGSMSAEKTAERIIEKAKIRLME